ncbi:pilus assembly protein PilP [Halieaceae bacterium IMCC14734]|uniref:Pilus assembly protein PilP n=1 Tax=Candidatus Litorirhabdus singularis TaxID=2518993 RepID=A0ABT3TD76_9GAMM|nr:pilus assembly protein PilP [Candidatus Litorirhabdus singularis]MCX2979775.1 pilus assembly protein PilP [Candidatus Litorirhabdus singularis]
MLRPMLLVVLIVVPSLVLVGCGSDEYADLDTFMDEKRARPGGVIAPIPPFKAYKAFSYSATTLRSPFDRPIEIREINQLQAVSSVKPDNDRVKEFLEQFTFDSLKMVGTLSRGGTDWTLVEDPDGGVHRVRMSDYLGRNHGRIVEMTENYIAVVEIVSDGNDGWVERPRSIKLSSL